MTYCQASLQSQQDFIREGIKFSYAIILQVTMGCRPYKYIINNNAWWAIRLSQQAREKLKYLAIYEKSPVAHISHYAEIERIGPYKDSGKYILYLKNKKTIKPIKLGKGKKGEAPRPQGIRSWRNY